MKDVLWILIVIAIVMVFPIFLFIKENPFDTASFLSLVSTRKYGWGKVEISGLEKKQDLKCLFV